MVARHMNPVANRAQEDTLSHRALHKALVAAAMAVALAVPATATAASGAPLIVPIASSEHATVDVLAAPASSSEHTAPGSPTALIVPGTNTEHRVTTAAAVTRGTPAPPSEDHRDVLAAAGLLLAVLAAALIVIRFQLRTRDVTV